MSEAITVEPTDAADEAAAQAALDALEQAAVDGQPVAPAELAEARERVRLAPLFLKGIRKREAERREAKADVTRAAAKAEVVHLLEGAPEKVLNAYDAAVATLQALIDSVKEYNGILQGVEETFRKAEVPQRSWTEPQHEKFDRNNFVSVEAGMVVRNVTISGKQHIVTNPSEWVLDVVQSVAKANRGLPVDYSDSIETRISASKGVPQLLQAHKRA